MCALGLTLASAFGVDVARPGAPPPPPASAPSQAQLLQPPPQQLQQLQQQPPQPPPPAFAAAPRGLVPPQPQLWSAWPPARRVPAVCVVVRTFEGQRASLLPLVSSIAAGRPPAGLRVILADTDAATPFVGLPDLAATLSEVVFGDNTSVTVTARTAVGARREFAQWAGEDYGYLLTDLVLENVLHERAHARATRLVADEAALPCHFVVVTNGDNLYHQQFFSAVLERAVEDDADVVATHFVSHYEWPGVTAGVPAWENVRLRGKCGTWRGGRDTEVATALRPACIDLGAAAFKAAVLEGPVGARFLVDRLRADPTGAAVKLVSEADGQFFLRLSAVPGIKTAIVRRALLVHQ